MGDPFLKVMGGLDNVHTADDSGRKQRKSTRSRGRSGGLENPMEKKSPGVGDGLVHRSSDARRSRPATGSMSTTYQCL